MLSGVCERREGCKTTLCTLFTFYVKGDTRSGLGSKLYLSNALGMLNKNLTRFVQSLFSVQSICTVRKGSACRVLTRFLELIIFCFHETNESLACGLYADAAYPRVDTVYETIYIAHAYNTRTN